MRITGGILGRRPLRAPRRGMRPTQDRVREAVFSSLAPRLPGAAFLDLFAGTGSVGLEARSRGCESVCWVEQDRKVHVILEENVRTLCGDDAEGGSLRVVRGEVDRFLSRHPSGARYDIVYADPPYDIGIAWLTKALQGPVLSSILRAGGVFIMEARDGSEPPEDPGTWHMIDRRRYGEAALWTYIAEAS